MNGVKEGKFDQAVLISSVEQVEIGSEDKNEAFDVVRKFELVRLSGRHEENAGRFNLIFIGINYMVPRTFLQIQHLKKVVTMRVFYAKMPVGIEQFDLKLLAFSLRRTEVRQAVNRYLFANLFHEIAFFWFAKVQTK
jgi:hypothetical protein